MNNLEETTSFVKWYLLIGTVISLALHDKITVSVNNELVPKEDRGVAVVLYTIVILGWPLFALIILFGLLNQSK